VHSRCERNKSNWFSQGLSDLEITHGILPKRIILGFLQTSAFDGAYAEDPYEFKNIGLLSLLLKVNSKSLPVTEGLKLDYDKNTFLDGYQSISKLNKDLDLSLEEYKSNFCFYKTIYT
jgi:hypothetical protein